MAKRKTTKYRNLDLDETGVVVSALPRSIVFLHAVNTNATLLRYLKIYDKASAATNADTPIFTFPIAPSVLGGEIELPLDEHEFDFANGISLRATTGVADNDVGAPGANEVVVNLMHVENLDHVL